MYGDEIVRRCSPSERHRVACRRVEAEQAISGFGEKCAHSSDRASLGFEQDEPTSLAQRMLRPRQGSLLRALEIELDHIELSVGETCSHEIVDAGTASRPTEKTPPYMNSPSVFCPACSALAMLSETSPVRSARASAATTMLSRLLRVLMLARRRSSSRGWVQPR